MSERVAAGIVRKSSPRRIGIVEVRCVFCCSVQLSGIVGSKCSLLLSRVAASEQEIIYGLILSGSSCGRLMLENESLVDAEGWLAFTMICKVMECEKDKG